MFKKIKQIFHQEPLWLQLLLFPIQVLLSPILLILAAFNTLLVFYRAGMKEMDRYYEEWRNKQCL